MDTAEIIRLCIALVFVLALMGIFGLLARKFNDSNPFSGASEKRLSIIEQRMLDSKNRLMLIKRDDIEHLIIVSNTGTIVVENGIPSTKHKKPLQRNKKDIPIESD
jgi:flagellar protein FliO/FliZ